MRGLPRTPRCSTPHRCTRGWGAAACTTRRQDRRMCRFRRRTGWWHRARTWCPTSLGSSTDPRHIRVRSMWRCCTQACCAARSSYRRCRSRTAGRAGWPHPRRGHPSSLCSRLARCCRRSSSRRGRSSQASDARSGTSRWLLEGTGPRRRAAPRVRPAGVRTGRAIGSRLASATVSRMRGHSPSAE
jgi:hypothetical protein